MQEKITDSDAIQFAAIKPFQFQFQFSSVVQECKIEKSHFDAIQNPRFLIFQDVQSGVGQDLTETCFFVNRDAKENVTDSDAIPNPRFLFLQDIQSCVGQDLAEKCFSSTGT